jgi:hypothetical protein
MIFLKQSTAATVRVGPFMDATNAVTPETGITLSGADQAELLKHTGATVDISGRTWAAITGCGGYYDLSLTTGDTDTLGMLTIVVQDESVCIPAPPVRAMVVPAMVYDSLVGGTDTLDVQVTGLGSSSLDAIRDRVALRTTLRGTVGSSSTTTSVTTSAMSPATSVLDQLKGRIIIFDHDTTTAALRGQASDITASSASATPTLTVTALTNAPASGDTFTIV